MILKLVFITAMWCNGLTFLSEPGEPLEFLHRWLRGLPEVIGKPLLLCISCMASVHTAIVLCVYGWVFHCLSWVFMRQYILVAPCAIVMNGILYLVRKIMEKVYFSIMD